MQGKLSASELCLWLKPELYPTQGYLHKSHPALLLFLPFSHFSFLCALLSQSSKTSIKLVFPSSPISTVQRDCLHKPINGCISEPSSENLPFAGDKRSVNAENQNRTDNAGLRSAQLAVGQLYHTLFQHVSRIIMKTKKKRA